LRQCLTRYNIVKMALG